MAGGDAWTLSKFLCDHLLSLRRHSSQNLMSSEQKISQHLNLSEVQATGTAVTPKALAAPSPKLRDLQVKKCLKIPSHMYDLCDCESMYAGLNDIQCLFRLFDVRTLSSLLFCHSKASSIPSLQLPAQPNQASHIQVHPKPENS